MNLHDTIAAGRDLPTVPAGVPLLLQAASDDGVDLNVLAKILNRFPSIVARVLSIANSSWVSPPCQGRLVA